MWRRARLTEIQGVGAVNRESEPAFWRHLQRAVLLALKDEGLLDEGQLQWALAGLDRREGGRR